MSYFIVDKRDRSAVRVTEDADDPSCDPQTAWRWAKVCADSVKEAIDLAGPASTPPEALMKRIRRGLRMRARMGMVV